MKGFYYILRAQAESTKWTNRRFLRVSMVDGNVRVIEDYMATATLLNQALEKVDSWRPRGCQLASAPNEYDGRASTITSMLSESYPYNF